MFIPFGGGSRECPGNELAKMEISVFFHYMLLHYEVERLTPDCQLRYLPHPRPIDNCPVRIRKLWGQHRRLSASQSRATEYVQLVMCLLFHEYLNFQWIPVKIIELEDKCTRMKNPQLFELNSCPCASPVSIPHLGWHITCNAFRSLDCLGRTWSSLVNASYLWLEERSLRM